MLAKKYYASLSKRCELPISTEQDTANQFTEIEQSNHYFSWGIMLKFLPYKWENVYGKEELTRGDFCLIAQFVIFFYHS